MDDLYVIMFIGLVLFSTGIQIYTSLSFRYERLKQSWVEIMIIVNRKRNFILKIDQALNSYNLNTISMELDDSFNNLTKYVIDISAINTLDLNFSLFIKTLTSSIKKDYKSASDPDFLLLFEELVKSDELFQLSLKTFKSNVVFFNTCIRIFPINIINKCLKNKVSLDNLSTK